MRTLHTHPTMKTNVSFVIDAKWAGNLAEKANVIYNERDDAGHDRIVEYENTINAHTPKEILANMPETFNMVPGSGRVYIRLHSNKPKARVYKEHTLTMREKLLEAIEAKGVTFQQYKHQLAA